MSKYFLPIIFLFVITPVFSESEHTDIVLVNGYAITDIEINYELKQLEQQAMIVGEQQKTPLNYAYIEELRNTVISTLINKHLILQECDKRNITINPEIINQKLLMLKTQFPEEQQFYDFLTTSHITEDKLLEEIKVALRINQLAEQIVKEHNIGIQSEEQKQKALATLLTELLDEAEIIWVD
ncbi:MAG: SurA N-terminal domain-containing protein [Candidatus Theseobacter exili]|nr:SurA N-terminal domain-containing protein [Candidatus Theseobacter exili]